MPRRKHNRRTSVLVDLAESLRSSGAVDLRFAVAESTGELLRAWRRCQDPVVMIDMLCLDDATKAATAAARLARAYVDGAPDRSGIAEELCGVADAILRGDVWAQPFQEIERRGRPTDVGRKEDFSRSIAYDAAYAAAFATTEHLVTWKVSQYARGAAGIAVCGRRECLTETTSARMAAAIRSAFQEPPSIDRLSRPRERSR